MFRVMYLNHSLKNEFIEDFRPLIAKLARSVLLIDLKQDDDVEGLKNFLLKLEDSRK